ncbi:triacylglycerol lipase [Aphanizomenon flos-aquae NRERC-008]|jgi:triacylglycerol lipase|uniref:Triacylglycerol lipase n=1 Tax=Aphanizomenon flos-aquae FACHB-1249 TaxID=2692889 RepID=A0ABR8IN49_APHFL|nr:MULTISPECIES: triacylglycerol lipase [Aphanizomenon]MCE2904606.1 triacylglycerol lipase [Anabaena sp. CoA2_C59]MDJ0506060.1 triacylglycerol lipase [Nostocales cyanobacterium LE14-WE12]MBD2389451.1 triacylglycerol lipase [Aphanizomenon flos-aquae FACHB-1171]MBD2555925.1 triacylglycerol lipase [Aphanizomenon flos-aquae FACHB-1290]MBD2632008.1 triacylglycerol lipase [Aphanizomenon sp. FACHB-1399]
MVTKQNPVLLVHGINDTGAVFNKMAFYLRQQGLSVYTVDLIPNNGSEVLEKLAQQVANYVNDTFEAAQLLDIVGFSMGGIVSRYYIQRLGGINKVQRFITISSPHKGTIIAYGTWLAGAVQMRPNSDFINDLNADFKMLKQLNFTSIWTPYDLMILPATSSRLGIGKEVTIPVILHPLMLTDTRTLTIVADALIEPVKL